MLNHLPDGRDVAEVTHRLLRKADAYGRWPTPVDDLVVAAGLVEPQHSMLSDFVLDQAPAHIRRAIRRLSGKVRALLDRREREIHLDPGANTEGRLAFLRLHEVSHDIFPWQRDLGYADDDAHFSPEIRKTFERQANAGAAELLFQRDAFRGLAADYAVGMAAVLELARIVGASTHATLRRFVECHRGAVAGVVMELLPSTADGEGYRRQELVQSVGWSDRFGGAYWPRVLLPEPYAFVSMAPQARRSHTAVQSEFVLPDLRNEPVRLKAEVFSNHYRLLVLIWVPQREILKRHRIIVPRGR